MSKSFISQEGTDISYVVVTAFEIRVEELL